MAASVLFACGLNDQKLPAFIHLSEESDVDGSFLISSILGQRLRISNAGTLLVCLQHKYYHYFNAGMRLGYNTNIFLGKTLNFIEPMREIAEDLFESKWLEAECKPTKLLIAAIREEIAENLNNRVSYTILIDNLSILFNLGASKEDIVQFCHELSQLPKQHTNLTVVTKLNNCDIYTVVDNNIAKLSDLRIRVIKLKSGTFREVDGKLSIERDLTDESMSFDQTQKKEILFKVNDRNVKIFNPGEIGVKV